MNTKKRDKEDTKSVEPPSFIGQGNNRGLFNNETSNLSGSGHTGNKEEGGSSEGCHST
jgi:hypothetical protein